MSTIPKYQEKIDVDLVIFHENNKSYQGNHPKMLNQAVDRLYAHMGNAMHIEHNHQPRSFTNEHHRKDFSLTPDDIMVVYDLRMEGKFLVEAKPTKMDIELKSFKTSVDSLKKELTDIIIQSCKEIKQ